MAQEQGLSITMTGGLDKTSSSFDLFKTPGAATQLINFESSTEGGYRRVNGYRKFVSSPITGVTITDGGSGYATAPDVIITDLEGLGSGATATATVSGGVVTGVTITNYGDYYQTPPKIEFISNTGTGAEAVTTLNAATTPDGTDAPIQGIYAHAEGGLAVQDGNIYWSEDGYNWTQVNYDYGTCNAGGYTKQYDCEVHNNTWTPNYGTAAQIATGFVVPLDSDARVTFTEYTPAAIDRSRVIICNGVDPICYFETYVDSGTRYFRFQRALYESFGVTPTAGNYALIPRPQYCETHADHLVVGGWSVNPGNFYYSDLYDDTAFTGVTAGEVNVSDTITGLKVFRNDLIIFGQNTIRKFVNINDSANSSLQDVTRNIGCLDGFSIQEIGGDLVFLAPDGIRTVAATTRIDDIELSSISAKIQPIMRELTSDIGNYQLSSVVIRSKNQYRLFFSNSTQGDAVQAGITGTFKISQNGVPVWEWSQLSGFPVACMSSGFDVNGVERLYHGDYNGNICGHDIGNSFDGGDIPAIYKTPDIDYGDIGIRKTLTSIKLSVKPEGETQVNFDVRYDFDDGEAFQPQPFQIERVLAPAFFSDAVFAFAEFGESESPVKKINLWGSGFSNSFKFYTKDTNAPYSIQGVYVSLLPASRR